MKYILLIFIVALGLLGITYLFSEFNFFPWTNFYALNIGFLVFLILVSDTINQKALEQSGRGVIIPYLVSTILKLIFSAVFLILLIKQNLSSAKEIVYSFLPYYAIFSGLEIFIVNRRLKAKKS